MIFEQLARFDLQIFREKCRVKFSATTPIREEISFSWIQQPCFLVLQCAWHSEINLPKIREIFASAENNLVQLGKLVVRSMRMFDSKHNLPQGNKQSSVSVFFTGAKRHFHLFKKKKKKIDFHSILAVLLFQHKEQLTSGFKRVFFNNWLRIL